MASWLPYTPDVFVGFQNRTRHACPRRCGVIHFNHRQFKCLVPLMQRAQLSCASYREFHKRQLLDMNSSCPSGFMSPHFRGRFSRAFTQYFYDCCAQVEHRARFEGGYLV